MRKTSYCICSIASVVLALCVAAPVSAQCSQTPSDNTASFDTTYANNIRSQAFVDEMWSRYSMTKSQWDEGLGFDDATNINKPLGRTFNAMWTLHKSMPSWDKPTSNSDMSGQALRWGGNYAASKINKLEGRCSSPSDGVIALTHYGYVLNKKNKTELFQGFFYGSSDIISRAATLLHEARHAAEKGHDGGDGNNPCLAKTQAGSICTGTCSCDENFSTASGGGANSYQYWFLQDYMNRASASTDMRNRAADRALNVALKKFDNRPFGL